MTTQRRADWFTWWGNLSQPSLERLSDVYTESEMVQSEASLSSDEAAYLEELLQLSDASLRDLHGRIDNRFKIVGVLGSGATSEVYEAIEPESSHRVAVKAMRRRHAKPIGAYQFAREVRVLGQLKHHSLPGLIGYGLYQTPGSDTFVPYIVMDLIEGEPLDEFVAKNGRTWQDCVSVFLRLCDAVSYIHANMLIIRDLKAEHVLVNNTKDGEYSVGLIDFGAATTFDGATANQRGQIFGTPGLMPPEQSGQALSPATSASDVYALGCIFEDCIEAIGSETCPSNLTKVFRKATSEQASSRYQDIASLRSALENCLEQANQAESMFMRVPKSNRHYWRVWLAIAAVCIAIAAFAIVSMRSDPAGNDIAADMPDAQFDAGIDGKTLANDPSDVENETTPSPSTENSKPPAAIGHEPSPLDKQLPRYYEQVHALSIGTDNLLNNPSGTQEVYENDAITMARLFQDRFAYNTETLTGDKATRANIMHAIGQLKEAGPDDAAIVFIALESTEIQQGKHEGYAASDAYLICADTPYPSLNQGAPEKWDENAISLSWLLEQVQTLKAKHVLILLNTGYSQSGLHLGSPSASINPRSAVTDTSRSVITAGFTNQKTNRPFVTEDQAGQVSNLQTTGNSIFVTALERALASNKAVSAPELYIFLNAYMRQQTGDHWAEGLWPQYQEFEEHPGAFLFIPNTVDPLSESEVVESLNHKYQSLPRRLTSTTEAVEVLFAPDPAYASNRDQQEQRWAQRIKHYRENTGYGDPEAMAALSHCYRSGYQVQQDAETAFQWATLAHRLGSPSGTYALSRCYRSGTGVQTDTKIADELLQKAAASGYAAALHEQSRVIENQQADLLNPDSAEYSALAKRRIALLQRGAQAGFGPACHELAMAYLEGEGGLTKNRRKVEQWAASAIDAGDAMGHLALADLHSGRNGLATTDQAKVISHLTAAADAGIAQAQFFLGLVTLQNSVDQDQVLSRSETAQAVAWLELAAQQGYSDADFELGSMYATGKHVQIDYAKAAEHMRRASAANEPKAMFALSGWYIQGTVLQKDTTKGVELLRKAADLNHAGACHILGTWYYDGKNVAADPPRGLYYLSKSARQDYVPALRVICQLFLYANPPWADSEQTSIKVGWRWHHESHKAVDAYRRFEETYREEDLLLNKYLTTATEPLLEVVAIPTTPQNQSTLYPVKETAAKLLRIHAEDKPEQVLSLLLPRIAARDRDQRHYISILVHMDRKNGGVAEEVNRRVAADRNLTQESVAELISSIKADRARR